MQCRIRAADSINRNDAADAFITTEAERFLSPAFRQFVCDLLACEEPLRDIVLLFRRMLDKRLPRLLAEHAGKIVWADIGGCFKTVSKSRGIYGILSAKDVIA